MIYRSNLTAPEVLHNFHYTQSRVQGHSFKHDVISDWTDKPDTEFWRPYKQCGFLTHDEAAILYHIGKQVGNRWLDIGAHSGWTAAHLSQAGCNVIAIEPMLWLMPWYQRFADNLGCELKHGFVMPWAGRSDQFFDMRTAIEIRGAMIDGDHDRPHPQEDAALCADAGVKVIVFHDVMGGPVFEAVQWLVAEQCYRGHVFMTPHMMAVCWKNIEGFVPPAHVPDPAIDWKEIKRNHMQGFCWEKVTSDV